MVEQERTGAPRTLGRFWGQHRFDPFLAVTVRDQALSQMLAEKRLCGKDVQCLKLLSRSVLADLRYSLYAGHFLRSPFFRTCHAVDTEALQQGCRARALH